ncbi:MAG: M20/M25/M40 family metallo-hydrolase [Anaerolineales bacterium]|nr:M20/M25/M40 family metallo-hydrolase [Anaerolineales bacterium]
MAAFIRTKLDALGYQAETDATGNVLVRLEGIKSEAPLVCYASHMDEIGVVVQRIDDDGCLHIQPLGGLHAWKLGERPLVILGDRASTIGVASMGGGHGASAAQNIGWDGVHLTTGLARVQLAEMGIRSGSPAVPVRDGRGPVFFGDVQDPLVGAWTFDDRMGVVTLLRLLEWLRANGKRPAAPTIIAFTVQEEVGGAGAKVVARRERPAVFVAIDGCPVLPTIPLALDGRPGIWTHDRVAPYDPRLVRDLLATARLAGTELQPAAYHVSASDASMVFDAGLAQRIACFGHVRENSHGFEVARLSVFDHLLATLATFVTSWAG